jgi:hypothetical protein
MMVEAIENSFLIDPIDQDYHPAPNSSVVIGGWSDLATLEEISLAFKLSADEIVNQAFTSLEFAYEYAFPVIFLYRHALEVSLKSINSGYKANHSFLSLTDNLIEKLKGSISKRLLEKVQDRIDDFIIIDQKSTRFRYGVENPQEEFTVDLQHLKKVINELFDIIEKVRKLNNANDNR